MAQIKCACQRQRGWSILDAVLANLAMGARIVICGAMSQYNLADSRDVYGCKKLPKNLPMMLFRRARMEGFLGSVGGREAEFDALLHRLYAEGKLLTVHMSSTVWSTRRKR